MEELKDRNMDLCPKTLDHIELCLKMSYGTGFQEGLSARSNRKGVLQLDAEYGHAIKEFPSAFQAQRETGINRANIANVCNNRYGAKTAGGYKWKWKEKNT